MPTTFAQLGLPAELIRALDSRGITEPFPVQAAAIPDGLAGRDVCGKAPTGSGKTLAFGLPVLANVKQGSRNKPKALILAPTRELAEQIKQELVPLARAAGKYVAAIYGGVGYGPQKNALRKGVDVLVATPGRLEDLMEQNAINLRSTDIVVLDEADRMADMGFMPAVRRILDRTAVERQTLLFSATLDGDIAVLSRDYQRDPVRHEAASVQEAATEARHHFWLVEHHDRVAQTADLIDAAGRSIVFTRTRHGADRLAKQLDKRGLGVVAIHGGRSQGQRKRALADFASGRAAALVATDVAARGIHIDAVESVVHFDPPADHKDYVHRSGRTARAGASGTVVCLVTPQQRKDVTGLLRDLDLDTSIVEPSMRELHGGGTRMQAPGAATADRETARPASGRSQLAGQDRQPARRAQRRHAEARGRTRDVAGQESVYVANLPWDVTDAELARLFGEFGTVHQATIVRRNGRSKGFGFVDMAGSEARTAVSALHGADLDGRDLTVRMAKPRAARN